MWERKKRQRAQKAVQNHIVIEVLISNTDKGTFQAFQQACESTILGASDILDTIRNSRTGQFLSFMELDNLKAILQYTSRMGIPLDNTYSLSPVYNARIVIRPSR